METLQWENVNRDKFAVFLRDLTENSKINLKHMIEDLDKTAIAIKEDTKHNSKKGKKKQTKGRGTPATVSKNRKGV